MIGFSATVKAAAEAADAPGRYQRAILAGLQRRPLYAGTVPPAVVARRRRANKAARVARRANRGAR